MKVRKKIYMVILIIIMSLIFIKNTNIYKHEFNSEWLNQHRILDFWNFDNQINFSLNNNIYYPKIKFISEFIFGNASIHTAAYRIIRIISMSDLEVVKTCITTSDSCNPNKTYLDSKNNIIISLKDNKLNQKVCVYVKNKDGFESTSCDDKTYNVDSSIPNLDFKDLVVYTDGAKYNVMDNMAKIEFGISGGQISCNDKNLVIGKNVITCVALGNNGQKVEKSFELINSPTYNKKAVFFGDSITLGSGTQSLKSWANYIGEHYDLSVSANRGKDGWTLSSINNSLWRAVVSEKEKHYDLVILHGGCNDVAKNVPIGVYDINDFSGNYDETTFVGGLELYLYYATTQWPNAKIGFIIPYRTPNNDVRNDAKSDIYYTKLKEVLDKWKIPYLDLFYGEADNGLTYSQILSVYDGKYMPDTLHINDEGYEIISPYIYEWMNLIPKYSDVKF